jgi:hypothetical protein
MDRFLSWPVMAFVGNYYQKGDNLVAVQMLLISTVSTNRSSPALGHCTNCRYNIRNICSPPTLLFDKCLCERHRLANLDWEEKLFCLNFFALFCRRMAIYNNARKSCFFVRKKMFFGPKLISNL